MTSKKPSSAFTTNLTRKALKTLLKPGRTVFQIQGLELFKKLAKMVHNHYKDIFAYWDATFLITNAYTEELNGLIKMANRLGRGYSYEIIRAKTLYSAKARKVGSGIRAGGRKVEYGPHIPTLLKQAESDELH